MFWEVKYAATVSEGVVSFEERGVGRLSSGSSCDKLGCIMPDEFVGPAIREIDEFLIRGSTKISADRADCSRSMVC